MERIAITPRSDWRRRAEGLGFAFHTIDGKPYWDETAAYLFTAAEIDEIEDATAELERCCMAAVEKVVRENLFAPFAAVTYRSNPQARVLAEVEAIPRFEFEATRIPTSKDIGLVWVGMIGVRYSVTPSVALDSGVSYRSDYRGLADASIHGGLNVLFPLRNLKAAPPKK